MKTLAADLKNIWVVSPRWIEESFRASHFLPPDSYGRRMDSPFKGKKVYPTPAFASSTERQKVAKALVVNLGRGFISEVFDLEVEFVLIDETENRDSLKSSLARIPNTNTSTTSPHYLRWDDLINLIEKGTLPSSSSIRAPVQRGAENMLQKQMHHTTDGVPTQFQSIHSASTPYPRQGTQQASWRPQYKPPTHPLPQSYAPKQQQMPLPQPQLQRHPQQPPFHYQSLQKTRPSPKSDLWQKKQSLLLTNKPPALPPPVTSAAEVQKEKQARSTVQPTLLHYISPVPPKQDQVKEAEQVLTNVQEAADSLVNSLTKK
jgi:hypothetical protein